MRKLILLLLLFISAFNFNANAQVFWTETFGTTGASGTFVTSYSGTHGAWTEATSISVPEGSDPNPWFVSCDEAGHIVGGCGTNCAGGGYGATLHIGPNSIFAGPDGGAMYDAGGFCSYPFYICVTTDRRAQSPTINCTGHANIRVKFYYIENGDGTNDNGTVEYYNGSTWSFLGDPPKTPPICPGGQGYWDTISYMLPASANGNPNVKIGFRWVNNDDMTGTDPSFAIDSITLNSTGPIPTVVSFTATATTVCQDSCITFTNTTTGPVDSFRWSMAGVTIASPTASPAVVCFTAAGTYTMKLKVYHHGSSVDSTSVSDTVKPAPHPHITKTVHTLSAGSGYTGYQWVKGLPTPIVLVGSTNSTYTYTVSGTYGVIVDSGGCKGFDTIYTGIVGVENINAVNSKFWVSTYGSGHMALQTSEVLNQDISVNIFDATGRLVKNATWPANTDFLQMPDLTEPPGAYIIRLSGRNLSYVLRWVKQ